MLPSLQAKEKPLQRRGARGRGGQSRCAHSPAAGAQGPYIFVTLRSADQAAGRVPSRLLIERSK